MRLAWFRPSDAADPHPFDDTAGLIRELSARHEIRVFDNANAHDFVWTHVRSPYDVCVFELDNTAAHAFIWPYLVHYGGVLLLRTRTLHNSRAHELVRAGRLEHYIAEFRFNEGYTPHLANGRDYLRNDDQPMLRTPLHASRLAVIPHRRVAEALQEEYPEARIRYSPLPVQGCRSRLEGQAPLKPAGSAVIFGVLTTDRTGVARRAVAHACEGGAPATLMIDGAERIMAEADVIVSLDWPGFGKAQTLALAAMGCGKPVVMLETDAASDWPVVDPQTWQRRGLSTVPPVGVSLDLRDEEHSLMLAIRRLAADEGLRRALGEGGRAWWAAHATSAHAAEPWLHVLNEAARLERPPRSADWPAHLNLDGTERAREVLAEFGAGVDFFDLQVSGHGRAR
jgi:hypothetical protein